MLGKQLLFIEISDNQKFISIYGVTIMLGTRKERRGSKIVSHYGEIVLLMK